MKTIRPNSIEVFRRLLLTSAAILAAFFQIGCFSTQGKLGGAPAILTGDGGPPKLMDVLESEPAPLRPDNHMDPIQESHGAVSLQFGEDLNQTARGPDKEPKYR